MRPLVLALLLFPVGAAAQDPTPTRTADRRLMAGVVMPVAAVGPEDVQTTARQTPSLPAPQVRRRPSMVGYVGDASIGTQLRIRVDAGFEITAADRAEFFYGKCACYRALPADHAAYDPEAPGPGPGAATDLDYQQLNVLAEFAVHPRVSVYGDVPLRWLQPKAFVPGFGTFPNHAGLGDIRTGVKVALVANDDQYLTAQFQVDLPSGDAGNGLGTDHTSVAPTLLYFQRVTDRVAVESQFGSINPIGGSAGIPTNGSEKFAGTVITYGVGASVELAPESRVRFAPVIELFGWHVVDGFQTSTLGPADGTDVVNLKVGARIGVADRGSLYVGYGRALTDDKWYHDIVRFEYRVGF